MIPPTSEEKYQEIKKKARRGLGWNYVSFGGTKLLSLVTLSILARLLPPENFGLAALATLTMDYLSFVSDLGFGAALIQKKHDADQAANTAFTINLAANTFLTILVFLAAPFAADFFREPQVTPVLRWLGLTFLIKSFGSIHNVLLERELDFKKKTGVSFSSSIIKAVCSIGLALAGFGVWALVVGQLIGVAVTSALLWVLVPWRPNLSWNPGMVRELFSYGLSIMGVNTLTSWEDNFDYLIIGRIFDTAALGIYTIAYRLPETLVLNTMWAMTAVLFPAFSALQDEKDKLREGFLTTVRYVEFIVVPICLGMIITADPLIRVAFGEEWVDAIPILQIISLYTLIHSIGFHAGDVYKAIGRPDILLKLSLFFFPLRLFLLWLGAQYSLIGVAFGHLAAELIALVVNFFVIRKMIGVSFIEILAELKAFIGGAVLIGTALAALYPTAGLPPLLRLIATTIAGGLGYLTYLWFGEREMVFRVLKMVGVRRE